LRQTDIQPGDGAPVGVRGSVGAPVVGSALYKHINSSLYDMHNPVDNEFYHFSLSYHILPNRRFLSITLWHHSVVRTTTKVKGKTWNSTPTKHKWLNWSPPNFAWVTTSGSPTTC